MADVEVTLPGGVKVTMPEENAKAYHDARTKDKAERDEIFTRHGQTKAQLEAAEAKAAKAEEDKQALELAKKGEVDKVRELLTKKSDESMGKFREKYRDRALEAELNKRPELLRFEDPLQQQRFIEDLVGQLRTSSQYDLDNDALVIIGRDGRPALDANAKPLSADAHIEQWIKDRPYYQRSEATKGSGAGGKSPTSAPAAGKVTMADIQSGLVDAGDIASGKVTVVQ